MAAYDLEEQEQIDNLKAWWKQHGNMLLNIVLAASLVVIAWRGWEWYQGNQSGQASVIYSVLQRAAGDKDTQKVKAAAGELIDKFGGTAYAPLGALVAAKTALDANDSKTARAQLEWAVSNGKDEVRDLARLRLAMLLLDEKAYDDALKQLDNAHASAFDSRYSELKGDILSTQGKTAEATAAYKAALTALDAKPADADKKAEGKDSKATEKPAEGSEAAAAASEANAMLDSANKAARQLLQQKLDALGGA
jgi:predicted negative regulator of RcsB-dependent stress response